MVLALLTRLMILSVLTILINAIPLVIFQEFQCISEFCAACR